MLNVGKGGITKAAVREPHMVGKPAEVAEHDGLVVDGRLHPLSSQIIQGFRSRCKFRGG